jgi:integrase
MPRVSLQKSGSYWKAAWRDEHGQRGRCLGRRLDAGGTVSKNAAEALLRAVERELDSGADPGDKTTLAGLLVAFLSHHPELAPPTVKLYRLTGDKLAAHFGAGRPIRDITRTQARDWRAGLVTGGLALSTVGRIVTQARTMFHEAQEDGLIRLNPFAGLKTTAPAPVKDWAYIDRAMLARMLDVCPNQDWRLLLALCRLAGLRRGEALALRWADVDLANRRLTANGAIHHEDTKHRRRQVPLDPLLADLLGAACLASDGPKVIVGLRGGVHRGFVRIAQVAGVPLYHAPLHTLRKACERDWSARFSPIVAADWTGHSLNVAARHYIRAEDSDFALAAGLDRPDQPGAL